MRPVEDKERAHVVWLKRDLRLSDHQPLSEAAKRGKVVGLYLYEPELLTSAEFGGRHLRFINESLHELERGLALLGGRLITRHGEAVAELERLGQEIRIEGLWSHAETGNWITYQRDLRVIDWCADRGIEWYEFRQDGVVRRLPGRNGWSRRWEATMSGAILDPPRSVDAPKGLQSMGILEAGELGMDPDPMTEWQKGGEREARKVLDSFLQVRGVNYRRDMSSPVEGWDGCSRISPYLSWGCISMKTVNRAAMHRHADLLTNRTAGIDIDRRWLGSLKSFQGRLRWHCHFMQKLEDEPEMEFQNLCRAYDGMREDDFNEEFFGAWKAGQTGYPLVDACMRAVTATGWLNFRMRAMVVSFASYHLWLHWRRTGEHLGRMFLDFEAGIHYSQFQMQSGTTGINSVRIYSPAKQAQDQDPEGVFIRRWVPELEHVPDSFLSEPHKLSLDQQGEYGCLLGRDYPKPLVEHGPAYREASREVFIKHGSRKGSTRKQLKERRLDRDLAQAASAEQQLALL